MPKKKTSAHAVYKAHINLECEYTKDGNITFKNHDIEGTNQILLALCLGLIKEICIQSKVNYREVLSQEIKNEVYRETLGKAINNIVEGEE